MRRRALARLWWSDWRANLRVDAFVILVLVAGVCLYGLYRTWSAGQASLSGTTVASLDLRSQVAAVEPGWVATLTQPPFRPAAAAAALVQRKDAQADQPAVRATLLSPWGAVQAWGFADINGWSVISTAPGSAWTGRSDLLVPLAWLRDGRARIGQRVTLTHLDAWSGRARSIERTVTGAFEGSTGVVDGPVLDQAALSRLSGIPAPNVAFAWDYLGPLVSPTTLPAVLSPHLPEARDPGTAHGDLPFPMLVRPEMLTAGSAATRVHAQTNAGDAYVVPTILLMFISLFVVASVAQIVRALDQQERLGVYKSVGLATAEVLWLNFASILLDVLVATAIGAGLLALASGAIHSRLGVGVRVDGGEIFTWAAFGLVLSRWGGRVAATLFEQADATQLLRRNAGAFDWWALIRF